MDLSLRNCCRLGLIGILTGFINGLLGIGGGTVLIPAMVYFFGVQQHIAHGTSLAIILPTALVSALIYRLNNYLDWALTLKIAASGMVGGYLGAKIMEKIPARRLKQFFGLFMILAGARMVL